MPLESNSNPYLTNDGYYRQNLSSVSDRSMYYKDKDDSEFIKDSIMLAGLVAATGGTAFAFYKQGGFQKFMNKFLVDFATSEGVRKFVDAADGVKKVTEREGYNAFQDVFDIVHNDVVKKSIKEGTEKRTAQQLLVDTELIKNITEKYNVIKTLEDQGVSDNILKTIHTQMDDVLKKAHVYDAKKNAQLMKQLGLREARIKDLVNSKRLSDEALHLLEINKGSITDIMDKVADKHIMVGMDGKIVDFRDSIEAMRKMGLSAVRDFQIPILGINPLKMFYVDTFIDNPQKPLFHMVGHQEVQPYISGRTTELRSNYVYSGGSIMETSTGRIIKKDMELVSARNGMYAINTRRLTGIQTMEKAARWDNPMGKLLFEGAKKLDFGMQDEVYQQGFDILTPGTWLPAMSQTIDDFASPVKNLHQKDLTAVYGKGVDGNETRFLVMNKSKGIKEEGFVKQLFAGRDSLQDVTKATHIPYMLMERMNASLQAFRLGLGPNSIGSAGAVFTNLMAKRILPVVVAIGALRYADYLLENKDGYSPKDAIADTYVTASVNNAAIRDKLGLTDFNKKLKTLTPGWDQLEELPIIGRLFSTKDKQETEEYWESGEDAVRKGRYWSLGNTPYTGGRTEYFRPNWVRRLKSDYKYTDVLYGSKEEYFENWWLPTPTAPLAPIKHFFTDPYHYDDKHYNDRPYPITGGINELREIPIIGGFLDATVGRLLKPREKMHLEYWEGEQLRESPPIQYTPYEEKSKPADRLTGAPGRYAIPTNKESDYETISYMTSSGEISIMAKPKEEDIAMINKALKEVSIKKAGTAGEVAKGSPRYGPQKDETLVPLKPGGVLTALEDGYQDITELAGFYGFSFTSLAGEGAIQRPRVQSSAEMNSYSRAFWEQNLGGFGGEISEIFRRFTPKKSAEMRNSEVNPIRNRMPSWMPGPEYYTDFLHGDPFIKANEGEYRLPGEGYDVMNGVDTDKLKRMQVGASIIGYDKTRIAEKILQADSVQDEQKRFVTDRGTKWHQKWEKQMEEEGVSISQEQYVYDAETSIGGFYDVYAKHDKAMEWLLSNSVEFTYYKAADGKNGNSQEGFFDKIEVSKMSEEDQVQFYKDLMTISENVLIDPKTRTKEKFDNEEMHFENVQQVNFYASKMHTKVNYLIHVDVNNPDNPIKVFGFEYNDKLLDYTVNKVEETRNSIRTLMDQGILNYGDLYSYFDRFKILADVAPYSENFRHYDRLMSQIDLDPEQKKEVAQIREQVSERKQQMRLYPYKFATANLKYENVTVKKVLDNGTVLTEEYDNPIKIAGTDFSTDVDKPEGRQAMEYLRRRLKPGQTINIGYTADELHKYEDDTYKSIKAVIQTRAGNLNQQMIQKGLAKDNEDDSPAAIHARFTKGEITYGKIWETLAHRDSYFHTKFMQTRSALEMYKRRDLYGKDWQEWTNPISDFLIPSMQNTMSKGVFWGTFLGAFVGSMFGRTRYGKIVGAAVGGTTMLAGSTIVALNEAITGEAYIPKRRQKERELNEYIDILKYVKNRRLFDEYRQAAIDKEGVDPAELIRSSKAEGDQRKERMRVLSTVKRQLHIEKISFAEAKKMTNINAGSIDELRDAINKELETLKNYREVKKITPLAAQAIMYYNESEKTAYGYDPGEPLQNILAALNRKERRYFQPFMEAPEEERAEIIKLVPRYMRRALQSAYGMEVDAKPELEEYFRSHALPGEDWAGWRPDVDLEDVKVKMVKHEGMDMSEFDYWGDDELRAEHLDIPVPQINYHQTAGLVKQRLRDVLNETGLHDIDVQVTVTNNDGINMDVDVENDRTDEIREYVRNYGII